MESKYTFLEDEGREDEDIMLRAGQYPNSWCSCTSWWRTKSAPSTKRVHRYMGILRSLLVYSLAFWGFLSIIQKLAVVYRNHLGAFSSQNHRLHGCDCGETVAEAMALGCKFDALSMTWLPKHCRDDELTA
ncbi:hypothetical protein CC86DRAFT_433404 [Ophiobolus disseminans]|uniref:Uncharacterized protein n=1 Tax=Ophiobolus disseminans TaxID=1469910 RepID=A0A6A6ZC32_9PLEO|nr:hypothetical protein CC86DRAFT_433404 [Ophiobolus disseminans]